MFKKALSLLVMLSMLALPMAALAESGETLFGRLTVSDPVVTYNGMSIDLTGLDLILSGAYDLTDTKDPQATVTAQVLADGKEAYAGALAIDKDKVAGMLNGLSKDYYANFADMIPDFTYGEEEEGILNSFVASMGMALAGELPTDEPVEDEAAGMIEALEGADMKDEGEVEITFNGETVTAQKISIALSEEQFHDYLISAYDSLGLGSQIGALIDALEIRYKGTIELYQIDENNVRVAADIDMTVQGESAPLKMVMDVTAADEENIAMVGHMEMTSGGETMIGEFTLDVVAPDENSAAVTMDMTMYPETNPELTTDMQMIVSANAVEGFDDIAAIYCKLGIVTTNEVVESAVAADEEADGEASDEIEDDENVPDDGVYVTYVPATAMTMEFQLTPSTVDGGEQYDYSLIVTGDDSAKIEMQVSGSYVEQDGAFRFGMDIDAYNEGDPMAMHFEFGGAYEEGDDYAFDGDMAFSMSGGGEALDFTMKLNLFISENIENRMLSFDDLQDPADLNALSEEDFENVNIEIQTVGISGLAILQQLPGVSALIQSLGAITATDLDT